MIDPRFPRFVARPPWIGGDLQTVRNYLRRVEVPLDDYPEERIEFPLADGDRLVAALHRPATDNGRPLAILIHGLSGSQDSIYLRRSARHLLQAGFPVLRFNLRGAGPSGPFCRLSYHAGRSEDLHAALMQLDGRLAGRGLLAVGYSMGGNLLLKYLGEQGRRALFLGAVSVSAPVLPKEAQLRIMRRRNAAYHRHLLEAVKQDFGRPTSAIPESLRALMPAIRTIYEFDDRVVAPVNGFADAEDYYARTASFPLLDKIKVPTLVIHARNDPWIPAAPYLQFDWKRNPKLLPLLPRGGGHVGFHALGHAAPWHDRCTVSFFEGLLRRGR
ncbi:MAG TPA: alpha/beta fold hydrolase [Hypericibacter adhaerens]|uniref:Amino acid ABC transporter n=1 Tax=Hypericibacter adhaerens TaxID=2602016 RepID=A0A5J6MZT2_9PROT|nr:alpha/beta fold hydrolase [Hypericibacter adhaerens]QEX21820.1 amino acid ABC transporter [Hypericibacter adhaerens]HWA46174.1 alpha/beta fold hydrolase [Hypericibacter adhaerens]